MSNNIRKLQKELRINRDRLIPSEFERDKRGCWRRRTNTDSKTKPGIFPMCESIAKFIIHFLCIFKLLLVYLYLLLIKNKHVNKIQIHLLINYKTFFNTFIVFSIFIKYIKSIYYFINE